MTIRLPAVLALVLVAGPAWAERLFLPEQGRAASSAVRIDGAVARDLASNPRAVALTDVPIGGGARAAFAVAPIEVFAPDAEVVAFDGATRHPLGRPDVTVYEGLEAASGTRTLILAIVDGAHVTAMVREGEHTVALVQPLDDAGGHALVDPAVPSPGIARNVCENHLTAPGQTMAPHGSRMALAPESQAAPEYPPGPTLALEVLVDVGNDLYVNQFGSNTTTASNYATALMGAVSGIYRRDVNVAVLIKQLVVWTTPEPFSGGDTGAQLTAYQAWNQANRIGVVRDIAHYLANVDGAGGRAYLDVLCDDTSGYGVSNLDGYYGSFPTVGYLWDVNVVSHELGHNFGSPHTHCYAPPLDHCYNQEAGCYAGPVEPVVGETMSYCHLVDTVEMGFSSTVTAVIRTGAENGTCIGNAPGTCGNGVLENGESCDDGNVADGDCCASNCAPEAGQPCTDDSDACTTDVCNEAGVCTHEPPGTCPACDVPTTVPPAGGTFTGTTSGTGTVTSSCGGSGPERVFSWTPTSPGLAVIDTCGSSFFTALHVRTGTCASGTQVACDDYGQCGPYASRVTFAIAPGTTYFVIVDGYAGSSGNFALSIGIVPVPTCSASPLMGCKLPTLPGKASLQLKDRSDDTKDQLQWKWGSGADTTLLELGSPDVADFYQLCLYDSGGFETSAVVEPGGECDGGKPCWAAKPKGFAYKNKAGTPEGIGQLTLTSGIAGKAKIQAKGRGMPLAMPNLSSLTPPLTVQLVRPGGPCWEAVYNAPIVKPDGSQLKAKSN